MTLRNSHSHFMKVKELAKLLFQNRGQPDKKLDCKLKKQEIVFDTAVFTYELLFDNQVRYSEVGYYFKSCKYTVFNPAGLCGLQESSGGKKGRLNANSCGCLL